MKLAIIGGGPVGLMTAINLAKRGFNIDVFEKSDWPKDKACGQGLMPSGRQLLEENEIFFDSYTECFPFSGVLYLDGEYQLKGKLNDQGFGVERSILSKKIFEKASSFSNIKLKNKTKISDVRLFERKVRLAYDDQIQDYDYVFACDGVDSRTRKILRNRAVRTTPWRQGAREHFNVRPWSDKIQVYWGRGIEAYVTPVSESKVEVAFLWSEEQFPTHHQLREKLWSEFPHLRSICDPGLSCGDFRGSPVFSTYSKRVRIENVFFVGDAYCFLDGITGEGLSLGFKASRHICRTFDSWGYYDQLKLDFLYLHYKVMVSFALLLSKHTLLRRFLFKTLHPFPGIFNTVLRLNDL